MSDKKLKIIAIGFVYNEIEFIKYKHMWCKQQDIDLYIIDNMSKDGTWEYLRENNIPSHRFDTQNRFNLIKLQEELIKTLHKLKPDWFIYNGCDTFRYTKNGLRKDIEMANEEGHDTLSLMLLDIKNTGEIKEKNKTVFNTYFYGDIIKQQITIGKYHENLKIHGDNIKCMNKKVLNDGVLVNYGMTKDIKDREETLARRQLAWKKDGLRKDFGGHYLGASRKKWKWNLNEVKDLRLTAYAYFFPEVQKLQNMYDRYLKEKENTELN